MKPDKISFYLALLIILPVSALISSCRHNPDLTNMPEICFERDVLPIYANNCAISGCHTGGGGDHERFALETYADIRKTVEPYKPESSESYVAITSSGGENHMPPGQVLSIDLRTTIRLWIEQGAKETTCTP
jgi:hypothetical protein